MKPGIALDKLIAEKIFGWVEDKTAPIGNGLFAYKMPNGLSSFLRDWSGDIKFAWEVVDYMRTLGWLFDLNLQARYTATFRKNYLSGPNTSVYEGKEDSASHAICLAALKAVGVYVSEWENR